MARSLSRYSPSYADEQSRPCCTPAAVCAPEVMFDYDIQSVKSPSTRASDTSHSLFVAYSSFIVSESLTLIFMARSTNFCSKRNYSAVRNRMIISWKSWRGSVVNCHRLGKATGSPESSFALCVRARNTGGFHSFGKYFVG